MEYALWNIWKYALCLQSVSLATTDSTVFPAESRNGAVMNVIICWSALSRFANHQKMEQPARMCQEIDIRLIRKPPDAPASGG